MGSKSFYHHSFFIILCAVLLFQPSLSATAQTVSLTFRGEPLSEALRQIDHAQDERRILFLPDELEAYTVTAVIDSLPAIDAVRRVCKDRPVTVTEVGRNIFVEYEPATVHLRPVVVDGRRVPLPSLLLAEDVSDSLAAVQQLARHMVYFNRLCPQERVWLHLDNTAYFQGETIWYAAYVTDDNGVPEPTSRVLYVELLSPTGVILQQQKLRIEHGRCHGSFPLVDLSVKKAIDRRGATNLPSGYYQIRAYTHSMLNFDDAAIFSRVIPVYQFPAQEGRYDNPVVAAYPYHEVFRPEPEKEKPRGVTVTFYPEGGHLVAGVPCTVAFKATGDNGLGIAIDGMRTADGRAVTLSPQHRGMGRFEWMTQKGGEQVIVTVGKEEYTFSLPKAEPRGCALHILRKGDNLMARIDAVGMTAGTLLAYTLSGQGQVCAFDTLHVSSADVVSCSRSIPAHSLPTGVYQFTLYNSVGNILAQRMLFIDNGVETQAVTFTATKPEYRPFERIQMTFQTSPRPSSEGKGGGCTFSLAVRDAADYGTAYHDDIRTYMLLSSELKGLIEEPGWYFMKDEGRGQKEEALDLLMMVQGWTRYDWQRMAGVKPFKVTHYTEQQLVVEGWAFSRILEMPLKNTKIDIRLISPERDLEQRATVTTDAEGYWSVGLQDFEGRWHLYYHTEQDNLLMKKATTRIRLDRSSKPALHAYTPIETFLPDPTVHNALLPSWREDISDFVMPRDAVQLDQVDVTAGTLYVDYGTFHAYDAAGTCEDVFDEGNYTYQLDEYLYYIGFYEDKYGLAVYPHNVHRYIIPMSDEEVLYPFNWRLMEKDLEYFKSVMVYDTMADPRVIPSFKTYFDRWMVDSTYLQFMEWLERGDRFIIAEVDYGSNANFSDRRGRNYRLTTFDGYSRVAEFYAPSYPDGPVQGDRDYRRTLYWNPAVTTDAEGRATISFYNNGYSRSLAVSAEGLTPDGIPIVNE